MKFVDGTKLKLEEFLEMILSKNNHVLIPNNHFPTDDMLNEFLVTVKNRSNLEIKELLRSFFIKNCTFQVDLIYKDGYKNTDWTREELKEHYAVISSTQHFKNIMAHEKDTYTIWEGITWIIDLLPHYPNEALRALDAYFIANCQFLPDSYFHAFADWTAIIRSKYIDVEIPQDIFLNLEPKEFEYLIAELFEKLGYKTNLTKSSYDGGIDIFAQKNKTGKKETLLIQCKRSKKTIGVDEARKLLGVVSDGKATKGTLITSSDFSRESKKFAKSNPRIELIGVKELTTLLNLHLGPLWTAKTDRYITNQKRKLN